MKPDLSSLRRDFPLLQRRVHDQPLIYLDSAATSLKPQLVIDAVNTFYTECTSNVHRAVHVLAEEATERYEGARRRLARFLNAEERELVLVRGTTEAINLVCQGFPWLDRVVTSTLEHHSNYLPWAYRENAVVLRGSPDGCFDLDELDRALEGGADLVTVGHVSNALGVLHPVEEIIARAHAAGAKVLLDAAQSAPHMPLDVKALDVDFLACSAHKMCGPGGVGVLYAKSEHLERMRPLIVGGHMVDQVHVEDFTMQDPPWCFEAGTPAIEATMGWGAAVNYLEAVGMDRIAIHDRALVDRAVTRLREIPGLTLLGPEDGNSRCAAVSFRLEDLEAHAVARMLSQRSGILVRSGFQCAQPFHETRGLKPTVRASFYLYNTEEEVDALADALASIASFL